MMYDELVERLHKRIALTTAGSPLQGDLEEAADAIEELLSERDEVNADSWKTAFEVERDEHRWIPVTERLPDDRRDVQITVFWHDAWRTMYGYYDGAFWHLYAPMHTEVADVEVIGWMEKTAPMPLPTSPSADNPKLSATIKCGGAVTCAVTYSEEAYKGYAKAKEETWK